MKKVILGVVMLVALGFVSCTDNTELIEEKNVQKQELFGINKGDVQNPGGGGEEDPDDTED